MARGTGPRRGSPEWIARCVEGRRRGREELARREAERLRRERERGRVVPADLLALERGEGGCRSGLIPHLASAAQEMEQLANALGGFDEISEPKQVLLQDTARLGAVLRASVVRFFETGDSEVASRIATLTNARRANLLAVGLGRFERQAIDYTKPVQVIFGGSEEPQAAQAAHDGPNDAKEEGDTGETPERAAGRNGANAGGSDT